MSIAVPFFTVEPALVQLVMLAMARLSGMLLLAPPFSHPMVSARLKMVIAFGLIVLIWPTISRRPPALATDVFGLAFTTATELIVGLTIGFVARFAIAAASVAAEMVSLQMGFGLASVLDPMNGAQVTVLTRLYDWMILMLFLALDAHHLVIGAVVESFRIVPIGGATLSAAGAAAVLPLGGRIFGLALSLVAPVLGILFIVNLIMVLTARAVPQLSLLTVGLPIMIALGLLALLGNLDLMSGVIAREIRSLELVLTALLRGFAGGR